MIQNASKELEIQVCKAACLLDFCVVKLKGY
jgi:hypothetical protein